MIHLEEDIFSFTATSSPSRLIPEDTIPNPNKMDTMPPSHLIDKFKVVFTGYSYSEFEDKGYIFKGYEAHGELYAQINKIIEAIQIEAWKKNEPERQYLYRDTGFRFALSATSAVENDRRLKLRKWTDAYLPAVNKVISARKDNLAYECARYWVEQYNKYKSWGPHTVEFVKAHETSHPTPGKSWNEVLRDGKMPALWNITSDVIRIWAENFDKTGNWCLSQNSVHFGNRQRSPAVGFYPYNWWTLIRCRQIGYSTGVSSLNAFIPHHVKERVIRHIFDLYENVLGCKIYSPKTEGGRIYTMLRDSYMAGKFLMHFDVSGMEIITPSIIQGRTSHFNLGIGFVIGYVLSMPELLSGVSPTSDWTMIAHLELLRYWIDLQGLRGRILYMVILGDDCTIVMESDPGKLISFPLYDRQISDDRMVRTLGLTTSEYMHPVGMPITIDRADKRMNLRDLWNRDINNKKTIEDRSLIAELFTGFVNEVPLQELIANKPPVPYMYSPKDIILYYAGLSEAAA